MLLVWVEVVRALYKLWWSCWAAFPSGQLFALYLMFAYCKQFSKRFLLGVAPLSCLLTWRWVNQRVCGTFPTVLTVLCQSKKFNVKLQLSADPKLVAPLSTFVSNWIAASWTVLSAINLTYSICWIARCVMLPSFGWLCETCRLLTRWQDGIVLLSSANLMVKEMPLASVGWARYNSSKILCKFEWLLCWLRTFLWKIWICLYT